MRYYFLIKLFLLFNFSNAQNDMAFKTGEWFKYKLSYSGWFKAGEATVNLNEDVNNNQLLHAKMIGKSTGAVNLFFKVYDIYESYFHKKNIKPHRFLRNINEGGYSKNIEILEYEFDNNSGLIYVPPGYANGAMNVTNDSEIMYFSNLSLEESAKDDIRFKSNYWDPWKKYSPEIYE